MTTPLQVMAARRAERQAALAAAQLEALQARQGQTAASTVDGRAAAQAAREQAVRTAGQLYPGDVLTSTDPRARRASREGIGSPMTGFYGAGAEIDDGVLSIEPGHVVTRAPTMYGVCVPEMLVTPGLPYTATVQAGDTGYAGLQWVTADGVPMYPVLWGRGGQQVQVTGVAPEAAFGLRMLLTCWADPAQVEGENRRVMADLTAWMAVHPE